MGAAERDGFGTAGGDGVSVIRREAIDAGLRVYSKIESDDPDEGPLEVALRVAVDTAIAALADQLAGAVGVTDEKIERAARGLAREFGEEVGWADWQRVARVALTSAGGQST